MYENHVILSLGQNSALEASILRQKIDKVFLNVDQEEKKTFKTSKLGETHMIQQKCNLKITEKISVFEFLALPLNVEADQLTDSCESQLLSVTPQDHIENSVIK